MKNYNKCKANNKAEYTMEDLTYIVGHEFKIKK